MPRGPGAREVEILSTLWSKGSATVAEIRSDLEEQYEVDFAYTTVLSHLQRLEAKGCVTSRREGKAYRYMPAQSRSDARTEALMRVRLLLFDGSREMMLAEIVKDPRLSRATIARMRRVLDRRLTDLSAA